MARQPVTRQQPKRRKRLPGEGLRLERRNLYILGGGIVAIILGYVLLGAGSTTAAPLLLVLGYCFLVPFSLFWRPRQSGDESPGPRPRETAPR